MKELIVFLAVQLIFVIANASSTHSYIVDDLKNQFQDQKIIALGLDGHQESIISLVAEILLSLRDNIDWISLEIDGEAQEPIDKYMEGGEAQLLSALSTFPAQYLQLVDTIREMNTERISKGLIPIQVIASGFSRTDLAPREWNRERGNYQYLITELVTGGFQGKGVMVGTPQFLAKDKYIASTFLAGRFRLTDELIETTGYKVRHHSKVKERMLHIWIEEAKYGIDAFAAFDAERLPSPMKLKDLISPGFPFYSSTSHPLFLQAENATAEDRFIFRTPKYAYRMSEQFDYFVSVEPKETPALTCLQIMSKAVQGATLRALSIPYVR